jgi:hypothetical protein
MCVTIYYTYFNQHNLEERDKEHTNMDHADFDGLEKPRIVIKALLPELSIDTYTVHDTFVWEACAVMHPLDISIYNPLSEQLSVGNIVLFRLLISSALFTAAINRQVDRHLTKPKFTVILLLSSSALKQRR